MNVNGTATLNGNINLNGSGYSGKIKTSNPAAGAGAGGSFYLQAFTVDGTSSFTAIGGNGSYPVNHGPQSRTSGSGGGGW